MQSLPNDDHTAAHQSALKQNTERCDRGDDQEEKRDHIYAEVFVKESKAAVSGKTTASRESLHLTCTEDGSNVDKDPVENLNQDKNKFTRIFLIGQMECLRLAGMFHSFGFLHNCKPQMPFFKKIKT